MLVFFVAMASICTSAQESIKVLRLAWQGISIDERNAIQQKYVVDLRDDAAYGLIIDNQGVNESSPSTTSGAALGGAVGNAMYMDRAFRPDGNYSAVNQLAVGIMGSVIGSSLDKPANAQFHFRYALKLRNGDIVYRDSVQSNQFRHPAGMCLELATLSPASQVLCAQTPDDLRRLYIASKSEQPTKDLGITAAVGVVNVPVAPMSAAQPAPADPSVKIECKLKNLAPVAATSDTCKTLGGVQL
jgi:hypothetical protein